METWIPTAAASTDKEELTLCKNLINELIPLVDNLTKAVKYYRSPLLTKDQYRELQEILKYIDSNELTDSSCCN